jgi:hypothetical protein
MPEVVELRVHGVGGSPAEGLLGVASASDCVQVASLDGTTSFQARRDDLHVHGYIWGKLTAKPLLQPLWLLLLPFTLLNVAGWMHRPVAELRGRSLAWLRIFRGVVHAIGAAFTVSFFVWVANTMLNRLYHGQTYLRFEFGPRTRVVVGAGFLLLIVGLIWLLTSSRQDEFESFKPPEAVRDRQAPGAATDLSLADPGFWNRARQARWLLRAHVAVAIVAIALVTTWAWVHASGADLPTRAGQLIPPGRLRALGIAPLATYVTEAALWGVVGLAGVHLLGWRRLPPGHPARFRWFGPAVAAGAGVAFGTMFAYAIPLLFGAHSGGRVAILAISFGLGTLALIAAAAGMGIWAVARSRRELELTVTGPEPYRIPAHPGRWTGGELRGVTADLRAGVAMKRTLSEAGRQGTTVLSAAVLVFVVTGLWQFRFGAFPHMAWAVRWGEIVAAAGTAGVLTFLIRNARKPNERRIVGIMWDVLTFWPRRFHPFAVRPYAERAVPELQGQLMHLVGTQHRSVILSCHSQGTVIGYASLLQLPADVLRHIAFVTYGCPLRQLHAMAFPAFFLPSDFVSLRGRLFDEDGGPDRRRPAASWRSFYRLTDYIGKEVFADPAFEEIVPDPAEGPLTSGWSIDRPFLAAYPDPPRTPWTDLALHSYYNDEDQLKAWLRELRARMGEQHAEGRATGRTSG